MYLFIYVGMYAYLGTILLSRFGMNKTFGL